MWVEHKLTKPIVGHREGGQGIWIQAYAIAHFLVSIKKNMHFLLLSEPINTTYTYASLPESFKCLRIGSAYFP